jgi:hypothetical protein
MQREYAVVSLDKVDIVGCDDATNTLMLFMKLGNFVGCAHFDYGELIIGSKDCGVKELAHQLEKVAGEQKEAFQVWIVGGFLDDNQNSGFLLGMMIAALNHLERKVDFQLICAEKLNDEIRQDVHYPKVMGAAFVQKNNAVVAAKFTHLGPAIGLRAALPCSGKERLYSCYDTAADCISIQFEYSKFEFVHDLLQVPDEFLLENLAGCPLQEPPRFLTTLRAGLEFLAKNMESEETFENGPVRFKRGAIGAWVKIKE